MKKDTKETTEKYNEIFSQKGVSFRRWENLADERKRLLDCLIKMIPIGSKVVDFGCGTGTDGEYLQTHGLKVLGVDLTDNMLDYAKKRIHTIRADMRTPPAETKFCNAILSNSALVHVKDKDSVLRKWHGILQPKGKMMIVLMNMFNPLYIKKSMKSRDLTGKFKLGYANYDGRHWYYESYDSFKEKLERNGFRVLRIEGNKTSRWLTYYAEKVHMKLQ